MGGSPAASISRNFLRQRLFGSRRADPSHRQEPFAEENFFDALPRGKRPPWRTAPGEAVERVIALAVRDGSFDGQGLGLRVSSVPRRLSASANDDERDPKGISPQGRRPDFLINLWGRCRSSTAPWFQTRADGSVPRH